jgi:hypothetical protein
VEVPMNDDVPTSWHYWTYGPSYVWPEGSPNANYDRAMGQLAQLMMQDPTGRFAGWYLPEENGGLDIYLEFSRSRPPNRGGVRRMKSGYRYSRRYAHDVLSGLSRRQIQETAVVHLLDSLDSITRHLHLAREALPSSGELMAVAAADPEEAS